MPTIQKPEMVEVNSSNIDKIGYDETEKTLFVQFTNGGTFKYNPVSKEMWDEFGKSESKGSWVWKNLRGNKSIKYEGIEN